MDGPRENGVRPVVLGVGLQLQERTSCARWRHGFGKSPGSSPLAAEEPGSNARLFASRAGRASACGIQAAGRNARQALRPTTAQGGG